MTYITSEMIAFYISLTTNVCFAALFIYHLAKEKSNKSLMILAGCLSLSMAFGHSLEAYRGELDQSGWTYYNLIINWYLIHVSVNAVLLSAIYGLHRAFSIPLHYVVRYVFRCLMLSIVLNVAMHLDRIVLGNRDTDWLYTLYSLGENTVVVFVFMSVLLARKWSEVFRWLQLAHSR